MIWMRSVLATCFLSPFVLTAQNISVDEIRLRSDPAEARVRPLESLTIQARAYAKVAQDGESSRKVRVRQERTRYKLNGSNSGWISKPFRFQGRDDEPFYQSEGRLEQILGAAFNQFVLQDSVLYTAPEKPGRYRIDAEVEGKKASITVVVDSRAPARKPREEHSFRDQAVRNDPYRRLVEHHSPFIAQETWFEPKFDYLARFDLDGDWKGDNNWDNAYRGSSQAYVYYAVMETRTHWFLIYNMFHPRDYSDKCVAGTCHENDNEGLILTVRKDGSSFGALQTMETLAHNNIYSYRADRRVGNNVHGIDGRIERVDSHPVVFVESGGHGVYGSDGSQSRYDVQRRRFTAGTGVTYIYKGRAERPRHPDHRRVGYELLPAYEHWWLRAHTDCRSQGRTFDDFFRYQPYGDRPRATCRELAGAFLGREKAKNKARPFWGWSDRRTKKKKVLAQGQWALDPAYAVSRNLKFPGSFSLEYTHNPYLGIQGRSTGSISGGDGGPRGGDPAPPGRGGDFRMRRAQRFHPNPNQGGMDIRLRVDGTIELTVDRDRLRYRVIDGGHPVDRGSEYTDLIPSATFRHFKLSKQDGRGDVRLIERPTARNGYKARLRISDPKRGPDQYSLRLTWQVDAKAVQPLRGTDRRPGRGDPGQAPRSHEVELFSDRNDPDDYDRDKKGDLDFRAQIDGTVVLRIRGDRVYARVMNGKPLRLDRFEFSQPLPASGLRELKVERKDGRGKVEIVEQPWEGNRFSALIRISDPKGGSDKYRIRLKWKR